MEYINKIKVYISMRRYYLDLSSWDRDCVRVNVRFNKRSMKSFNQFFSCMSFALSIRFIRSDVTRFIDRLLLLEHSALVYLNASHSLILYIWRIFTIFFIFNNTIRNIVKINWRKQRYIPPFCLIYLYRNITRAHLLPRLHGLPL